MLGRAALRRDLRSSGSISALGIAGLVGERIEGKTMKNPIWFHVFGTSDVENMEC
jgi:hypothetical protein